jgi:thiol-disulfide isomerase/thioredoxin
MRRMIATASLLWLAASAFAAEPQSTTAAEAEYERIDAEFEALRKAHIERCTKLESQEERTPLIKAFMAKLDPMIGQMLELAERHAQEQVGLKASIWVTETLDYGPRSDRALELVTLYHTRAPEMAGLCMNVGIGGWNHPNEDKLLRAVLKNNPSKAAKAQACFALGKKLDDEAELLKRLAERPEFMEGIVRRGGDEAAEFLKQQNEAELRRDAEALFERVIKEFSEEGYRARFKTLGDAAEAELIRIHKAYPEIGTQAKEIAGEDLDGRPMTLSEFRGKVVVLTFWGSWCGPCMARVEHENHLAQKYDSQRFAMLGVNADDDMKSLNEAIAEHHICWRSWRDGWNSETPSGGPISLLYDVHSWPTTFVIDPAGVIRHKNLRDKELEDAVDALLKESKQ